jgi:hypothetical protein
MNVLTAHAIVVSNDQRPLPGNYGHGALLPTSSNRNGANLETGSAVWPKADSQTPWGLP